MRRISGQCWVTRWVLETIIFSSVSLPRCLISLALLTPGWGTETTKDGVDLVLSFAGPPLQKDTGAGWLMILAREGLRWWWITRSRQNRKGGKSRRKRRSQSEMEEQVLWDKSAKRLERKGIGYRVSSWSSVFTSGKFSVVTGFKQSPWSWRCQGTLRWIYWMDHTCRH